MSLNLALPQTYIQQPPANRPNPDLTPAPSPKKRKRPNPSKNANSGPDDRTLTQADDTSDVELEAYEPPIRGRVGEEGEGEDSEEEDAGVGDVGAGKKVDHGAEILRRHRKRRGEQYMLRQQLDKDQGKKFDDFSAAVLSSKVVNRLSREVLDNRIQLSLGPIVAGLGKIFIAEVTELAKDIQAASSNPRGPLQVHHLRLARLELERRGMLRSVGDSGQRGRGTGVALRPKKPLFKR